MAFFQQDFRTIELGKRRIAGLGGVSDGLRCLDLLQPLGGRAGVCQCSINLGRVTAGRVFFDEGLEMGDRFSEVAVPGQQQGIPGLGALAQR